jgi:hypothetical protein
MVGSPLNRGGGGIRVAATALALASRLRWSAGVLRSASVNASDIRKPPLRSVSCRHRRSRSCPTNQSPVEMEFTPGVLRVLRRHGFLEGEPPDLIIASVFGMLGAAVDAGIRAKPEPAPVAAAPPPAPAAPPPVAAAPRRPPKAPPPPAKTCDRESEELSGTFTIMPARICPSAIEPASTNNRRVSTAKVPCTRNLDIGGVRRHGRTFGYPL